MWLDSSIAKRVQAPKPKRQEAQRIVSKLDGQGRGHHRRRVGRRQGDRRAVPRRKGRRSSSPAATRPSSPAVADEAERPATRSAPSRPTWRRPTQCQALIDAATKAFGRVDILVNNAGTNIKDRTHPRTDARGVGHDDPHEPRRRVLLHEGRAAADVRAQGRRDRERGVAWRASGPTRSAARPTSRPSSAWAGSGWCWRTRRRTAASA